MKSTLYIIITLILSTSFAKDLNLKERIQAINHQNEKCLKDAVSTLDINLCSSEKLDLSTDLLKNYEQKLVSDLKSQAKEEKNEAEYDQFAQETLDRLVLAQKHWTSFRDAECNLASTSMLKGSGENMIRLSCLADQTLKRVQNLMEVFAQEAEINE